MTVGKSSETLGYKKDSYGSFSTGADFYYPPFSPPPKHNFDPESSITVTNLTRQADTLYLKTTEPLHNNGNVTLWIGNKRFPATVHNYASNTRQYQWPHPFITSDDPTWSGQRTTRSGWR